MRFLVDAQLPPALARWLTAHGHEAEHVADIGLLQASDAVIWSAAVERGATIVTKDEDFAMRRSLGADGPLIVWLRLGNSRTESLLRRMELSLDAIAAALGRDEPVVEVV